MTVLGKKLGMVADGNGPTTGGDVICIYVFIYLFKHLVSLLNLNVLIVFLALSCDAILFIVFVYLNLCVYF